MTRCQDIRERMILYLDEELQGSERVDFEKHLRRCDSCSLLLQHESGFLQVVRNAAPLPLAPNELRARVEALLDNSLGAPAQTKLQPPAEISFWSKTITTPVSIGIVTIGLIAVLSVLGVWLVSQERDGKIIKGPSEFALMAVDTHLRHLRGQLPLEITSETPQRISSWFNDKLPFSVKLPNYQESSGQEKLYKLEGARLVGYKNDYAAYVAYQMRQRPISLVITSNAVARPSGGQEIAAKGLTFHYDSISGLKVITWSDRGLTYALVSDLEERGQQSCIVCHHGTSDREFIETLKPKS